MEILSSPEFGVLLLLLLLVVVAVLVVVASVLAEVVVLQLYLRNLLLLHLFNCFYLWFAIGLFFLMFPVLLL